MDDFEQNCFALLDLSAGGLDHVRAYAWLKDVVLQDSEDPARLIRVLSKFLRSNGPAERRMLASTALQKCLQFSTFHTLAGKRRMWSRLGDAASHLIDTVTTLIGPDSVCEFPIHRQLCRVLAQIITLDRKKRPTLMGNIGFGPDPNWLTNMAILEELLDMPARLFRGEIMFNANGWRDAWNSIVGYLGGDLSAEGLEAVIRWLRKALLRFDDFCRADLRIQFLLSLCNNLKKQVNPNKDLADFAPLCCELLGGVARAGIGSKSGLDMEPFLEFSVTLLREADGPSTREAVADLWAAVARAIYSASLNPQVLDRYHEGLIRCAMENVFDLLWGWARELGPDGDVDIDDPDGEYPATAVRAIRCFCRAAPVLMFGVILQRLRPDDPTTLWLVYCLCDGHDVDILKFLDAHRDGLLGTLAADKDLQTIVLRVIERILQKYPTVISKCPDPIAFTDALLGAQYAPTRPFARVLERLTAVCPGAIGHFLHPIVDPWLEQIQARQFEDVCADAFCTIIQFSSVDGQPPLDLLREVLSVILGSLDYWLGQRAGEAGLVWQLATLEAVTRRLGSHLPPGSISAIFAIVERVTVLGDGDIDSAALMVLDAVFLAAPPQLTQTRVQPTIDFCRRAIDPEHPGRAAAASVLVGDLFARIDEERDLFGDLAEFLRVTILAVVREQCAIPMLHCLTKMIEAVGEGETGLPFFRLLADLRVQLLELTDALTPNSRAPESELQEEVMKDLAVKWCEELAFSYEVSAKRLIPDLSSDGGPQEIELQKWLFNELNQFANMVRALLRISDRIICHCAVALLACSEKCAPQNNKKLVQLGLRKLFERIRGEIPMKKQRSRECHELLQRVYAKLKIPGR
jgi:hypothetical protein